MSEVKELVETQIPGIAETTLNGSMTHNSLMEWLKVVRGGLKSFDVLMVYTNTPGGSVEDSVTAMEALHSYGKKIVWVSELFNASMGVLVPQFNDSLRLCYPTSRFMMHGTNYSASGTIEEINNLLTNSKTIVDLADDIAMKSIGLTKKEYTKLCSMDRYISAKEFIEMGTRGGVDGLILKQLDDENYLCQCRGGVKKIINAVQHNSSDVPNIPEYTVTVTQF